MDVKLIVLGGKNSGQEVPVTAPRFLIGRADDCHLRPKSDMVSRHHAAISIGEGLLTVRDLGSRNGVHLNGRRIESEEELKAGDRLKIGPLEFEVQLEVAVGGKKRPKVSSVQEAAARTVENVNTAADDLDISSWLEGEDPAPGPRASDTQSLRDTPTAGAPLGARQEPSSAPPPDEKKAKKPSRPKFVKPKSEDSRTAADEVLRRFFGRKS